MYFIAGAVFLGLGLLSENIFMRILFFAISVYYFLKLYKRHKEKKSAGSTRRVKNPSADVEKPKPREVPRHKRITVNAFMASPPEEYVAFDLETTGLSPQTDRIIEIGAVYVDHGQIIASFSQLVDPRMSIPAAASEKNNITDAMVRGCPTIDLVLPEFRDFIGDVKILAAHNATFDANFLMAAALECGIQLDVKFFDTLALSRAAWPNMKNHKLETLADKIKHPIGQAHRAAYDAEVLPDLIGKAVKAIRRAEKKRAKEENE
jgi:exonuclease, DNA polymerase III, epsilon subunit family